MEGLIFGILRYSVSESVDQTTEWLFTTTRNTPATVKFLILISLKNRLHTY